jgi:hypothetical protein
VGEGSAATGGEGRGVGDGDGVAVGFIVGHRGGLCAQIVKETLETAVTAITEIMRPRTRVAVSSKSFPIIAASYLNPPSDDYGVVSSVRDRFRGVGICVFLPTQPPYTDIVALW